VGAAAPTAFLLSLHMLVPLMGVYSFVYIGVAVVFNIPR
jgi:hypothetical protein